VATDAFLSPEPEPALEPDVELLDPFDEPELPDELAAAPALPPSEPADELSLDELSLDEPAPFEPLAAPSFAAPTVLDPFRLSVR
jgi:hypothetical protein